ncbi:MAG: HepT-like ribonuclease domain-containing protein [Candidatus Sulfotelmatobacter sp.]
MNNDPLNDLIHSIPTSRILLQKAHKEGALIEGLCLYVSTIDALLRLALVYSRTQKAPDYTYEIPKTLIRQDEGEKTYSEKAIYDLVLEEKVISDDLHRRLYEIYDFRNRVVHRFNISGLRYADIAGACTKFEPLYREVLAVVDVLENGPHSPRAMSEEQHASVVQKISDKIGQ